MQSSSGIMRQYINSKLLNNLIVYDDYDDDYVGRDVAQVVIAALLPGMLGFNSRPVHMRIAMGKVPLGEFISL